MSKTHLVKKPFAHHLAELRSRLLIVVAGFLIGSIIGYYLAPKLTTIILHPLHQSVYYSSPVGGFNLVLTISFLVGILVAIPLLLYQSLAFIKPLLPQHIIKESPIYILASICLLVLGITFAYFIVLPASLHFFSQFSTSEVKSLISANDYLSFVTKYFLGFGLVFQLPLILLLINSVVHIPVKKLFSYQRIIIVVAFVIGAILSPDPFNMFLMSLPIILLYYISLLLVWAVNIRRIDTNKKVDRRAKKQIQ